MKRSPLFSIFLIVLVDVMGLTLILPLLPFYAQFQGATPAIVGLLFSSYAICQLISGPILGMISDRVGRRPVLLVSQIGTFLGFLLLAFSNNLVLVFAARILDGLTAGNLTVAQAYIADHTTAENRAKSFALIGISFGVGFLIGPAVSGVLAKYNYTYPIFFAAFLSFLSIMGTLFLLVEDKKEVEEIRHHKNQWFMWGTYLKVFQNPQMRPLLLQFLSFIFTFAFFMSGFAMFAERRFTYHGNALGPKEVGFLFAFVGLLGIFVQGGILGRFVKLFGEVKLIRAAFFLMSVGALMLGFIHTIPMLVLALSISFVGSSFARPCLTSVITQRMDRSQQGMVLGLTQSLTSISQITAPIIGGLLLEHSHLSGWAWVGAAVSLVGFILCLGD